MPTYDYRCNSCSHTFELFQSMKDAPKRKCPKCGKSALERLIGTGAAIMFKGSGFYETDYRSESYKKAAEADKPAPPATDKPADKGGAAAKDSAKPAETKAADTTKSGESRPPEPKSSESRGASKHAAKKPSTKPSRGKK